MSPINVHTDGVFLWPEDLAYYVETYGVPVPEDLRLRALAGAPGELTPEQVDAAREWLLGGMGAAGGQL